MYKNFDLKVDNFFFLWEKINNFFDRNQSIAWHFGFWCQIRQKMSAFLDSILKNVVGQLIEIGFMAYTSLQYFCPPFKVSFFTAFLQMKMSLDWKVPFFRHSLSNRKVKKIDLLIPEGLYTFEERAVSGIDQKLSMTQLLMLLYF